MTENEEGSMTAPDDKAIAEERRLIGLFAEMRQAAVKVESTVWGAAKHDIAYLRARLAADPKVAMLLLRLFQVPPPVRSVAPSLSAHGTERPTARDI
jgi:hypothetical protein